MPASTTRDVQARVAPRLMVCFQRTLRGRDLGGWKFGKTSRSAFEIRGSRLLRVNLVTSPGRSESAIKEVQTPCARLRVLPSLTTRTSQWSAVSTGPCFRCGQRSVTLGYATFRLWTASDKDKPCSPVSPRILMPPEPGTLTQRFRGDGRFRAWRGRSLDSTVNPHPGGETFEL